MNGIKALKRLLIEKNKYYLVFLLGLFFVSNSIYAQTPKLPTNEELVKYFKETEYSYIMRQYYKSFLHEFDSYITAPKLKLEQSSSFKELCNHFMKYPSVEELEPIIIERIHFKLFRDDFKYWSIKCKLDNKEHSFLITGAGRIIHQDDNCYACRNIRAKRAQLKKQITEYIDYLKKKYGNLDNALEKLITSSTKSGGEKIQKEEDAKELAKAKRQAKRDSLTNAIREINLKTRDNITLNFENSLCVPISEGSQIRIKNFFIDDDPNASVIATLYSNDLILETNEALWIINKPEKVVNDISFNDLVFYNVLDSKKQNGHNIKIPKISPIMIIGNNNKVINEFKPTIIKDKNGEIKRIQLAKFENLQTANTELKNKVESILRQCKIVEAYTPNNKHFVIKYGNNEKQISATKNKWASLLSKWNDFSLTNLHNQNFRRYSQEDHNLLFFESLKPNGGKNRSSVPKLYIYETDGIIYIGDSYLSIDIATNNLSDDIVKIDKSQAFAIKSTYWERNTTMGGGKYRQKTVYKYKPKKK